MEAVSAGPGEPKDDRDDWDRHWLEYARSNATNPAQDFRRRLILRRLAAVAPPARILDVGSGTGVLAADLRAAYPWAELLGLELSPAGVEQARGSVPDAEFLQRDLLVDASPPPEYARWATHAVCSEVLEHVDDPERLLVNVRAFMAPGCFLVVTVPGGPMTAYDRHIGHRRHFRADDLAEVLRASGFDTIRASGVGFPVFNLYRVLMRVLRERLIVVARASRPSVPARVVGSLFATLLPLNTKPSSRGWQIIATAVNPTAAQARGA